MNEKEMVQDVVKSSFLMGRDVFTEIPVGRAATSSKRIDIVVVDRIVDSDPPLTAIEAKLANWKQALRQAFLNLFVANYSYVVIPESRLRNVDRNIFQASGIGILTVNGSVESVVEPQLSTYTLPQKKGYVLEWCRKVKDEHNAPA